MRSFREFRRSCYGRCVPKSRLADAARVLANAEVGTVNMPRQTLPRSLETSAWLLPSLRILRSTHLFSKTPEIDLEP